MRRMVLIVALSVLGLLAAGCATAPGPASTAPVSYLWVVNSEGGTITGTGDAGLTLTLTGVRDYATQFADRPVRHAYVLSTTDFATRWEQWFSPVTPNAVLSFTEPSSPMPASIVLEVTDPVYDKAARTLVFDAARLHREPDPHPDAVEAIALPNVPTPATFMSGALFIDSAGDEALPEPDASDTTATTDSACRWGDCPTGWVADDGGQSAEPAESSSAAAALAGYRIGDTGPGGGIVFYDAGSPQPWGRYLEAAPDGWNGAAGDPENVWCDVTDSSVAGTKTGIGTGAANTKQISAACTSGAATTVSAYRGGGLTDWFLPSKDELNALYGQKSSVGGFVRYHYWSSSQFDADIAWFQFFSNGGQHASYEDSTGYVRPVRAF